MPDPIQLSKIDNSNFIMTTHDLSHSCQLMKIDSSGFTIQEKLETEDFKVFSVCMLNSGIPGISMPLDAGAQQPEKQTLILGCLRGFVLKFEKGPNDQTW